MLNQSMLDDPLAPGTGPDTPGPVAKPPSTRGRTPAVRPQVLTELGPEQVCRACQEVWPADKEFYIVTPTSISRACRACSAPRPPRKQRQKMDAPLADVATSGLVFPSELFNLLQQALCDS